MSDVFNCPPVCNKCFQRHPIGENCKSSRSPAGYESEYLQNVRRTLEAGLKVAQHPTMEGGYIDLFTHALDELRRAGVEFPES